MAISLSFDESRSLRFLYTSRKVHPPSKRTILKFQEGRCPSYERRNRTKSKHRKIWPMPVSRKILNLAKFWIHHWKGLKKLCYWWKNGWTCPKGCLVTAVFRLKKGIFQRPIFPGVRLTLTRDCHQWKIWTFFLPCIPTLGGWRTNAWPINRPWSEPTLPFLENLEYTMSRYIF